MLAEGGLFPDLFDYLEVGLLPQLFSILNSPFEKMLMEYNYKSYKKFKTIKKELKKQNYFLNHVFHSKAF